MQLPKSDPILGPANSCPIDSAQPSSLSYMYNFGSLLAACLVVQIVTGVLFFAFAYQPSTMMAFTVGLVLETPKIPTTQAKRKTGTPKGGSSIVKAALEEAHKNFTMPNTVNPNAGTFSSTQCKDAKDLRLGTVPTPEQHEVGVGMVLSDAHATKGVSGSSLKFHHGVAQQWLVEELFRIFHTLCWVAKPAAYMPEYLSEGSTTPVSTGKVLNYGFSTWVSPYFKYLRDDFYDGNVKTYTSGIVQQHLTELGFAYLYMGDGALHHGITPALCLCNLPQEQLAAMNKDLNQVFGLNGRVVAVGKYFEIHYPPVDRPFFRHIGQKHLLPIFSYKIPAGK